MKAKPVTERKQSQLNAAEVKLIRALDVPDKVDEVSGFTLQQIVDYLGATELGKVILRKHGVK